MSLFDWQAMYSANVETTMLCAQAAARHRMSANGGALMNIGSTSAPNPGIDHSHYNSAKAAVIMLTLPHAGLKRRIPCSMVEY